MKRSLVFLFILTNIIYTVCAEEAPCDSFLTCALDTNARRCSDRCFGKTFFSIRPQDSDSARRLFKIAQEEGHAEYNDCLVWGFNFSLGAQHTFFRSGNTLAKWFLFNCTPCMTVGVPNEAESFDVDGRQLGLLTEDGAPGFIGNLSLNPTLKNIIGDFYFWFDLNYLLCGLWLRTNLTVVRAKTNLNFCSCTESIATTTAVYAPGDYTINCTTAPITSCSITNAFIGDNAIGVIPPLHYGKFYCDSLSETAVAGIRFDLGFDVIKSCEGFLNIVASAVVPTGTRPNARRIFEPVVGANKSAQFGGAVVGAYHAPCNLSVYFDATITHLFKAKQTRLFNLNNGPGSQYLLIKEFDFNVGATIGGNRAANLLAGEAKIGANIMFDSSLMMQYQYKQFLFDIGYNFWMRSNETMDERVCFRNLARGAYGIKGDTVLSEVNPPSQFCIGNLATESRSTIRRPAPQDAETVFLTTCDINFSAPLHPTAFSNKIFASIGYSRGCAESDRTFFAAVQGQVEFGKEHKAIDQWSVTFYIGSSF